MRLGGISHRYLLSELMVNGCEELNGSVERGQVERLALHLIEDIPGVPRLLRRTGQRTQPGTQRLIHELRTGSRVESRQRLAEGAQQLTERIRPGIQMRYEAREKVHRRPRIQLGKVGEGKRPTVQHRQRHKVHEPLPWRPQG